MPKFTDKSLETPGGIASYDDRGLSNFHLLWESGTGTIKTRIYSTANGIEKSVNAVYVAGPPRWIRDDDASPAYLYGWSKGANVVALYEAPAGSGTIVWSNAATKLNYHARQFEGEQVDGSSTTEVGNYATTGFNTLSTLSFAGQYVQNGDFVETESSFNVYDVGTGATWEVFTQVNYNTSTAIPILSTYRRFYDTIHGPQVVHISGTHTLSGITGVVTDLSVLTRVSVIAVTTGSVKIHGPVRTAARVLRGG